MSSLKDCIDEEVAYTIESEALDMLPCTKQDV